MSVAVIYADAKGDNSLDVSAMFDSAVKLVMSTHPPEALTSDTLPGLISEAYDAIIAMTGRLVTSKPFAQIKRDSVPQASESMRPSENVFSLPLPPKASPAKRPEQLNLLLPAPEAKSDRKRLSTAVIPPVAEKPVPKRRRSDAMEKVLRLPRRLSKIEDALKMDAIICLEDGKSVQDLGAHLASIGMTPEKYLEKWKLPKLYPMKAPNFVARKGFEYEYDLSTRKMIKT